MKKILKIKIWFFILKKNYNNIDFFIIKFFFLEIVYYIYLKNFDQIILKILNNGNLFKLRKF